MQYKRILLKLSGEALMGQKKKEKIRDYVCKEKITQKKQEKKKIRNKKKKKKM
jgi:uridylate kinase